MRVSGCRQGKVAIVLLRIPRLLQRTQHEEAQNPFLRLAGDFLSKLLIHARRDVHFLGEFDLVRTLPCSIAGAPVRLELYPLNWQSSYSQRVTERRGDGFEVIHALGVGLLVNAVER